MVDLPGVRQVANAAPPPEVNRAAPAQRVERPEFKEQAASKIPTSEEDSSNVSKEDLAGAVEEMNEVLSRGANQRLKFGVHEGSNSMFVQVIDRATNDVVKTFPPEQFLELRERLADSLGALIDQEV